MARQQSWHDLPTPRLRQGKNSEAKKEKFKNPPAFLPRPLLRAENQPRQGESETPDKLFRPAESILLVLIIWILLEIVSNFVQQTPLEERVYMFTTLTTNFLLNISLAHWLVILSAVLSLSGSFAYIRDMFRGKSKPNLVTWGLWAFAPLIATGAAFSASADIWATARIFMAGFGPLLVFVTTFLAPQSYWKLSFFDYACGSLSLVALGVWLGANSPLLAILLAAIADLFATLPTIIKAWKYPETETVYTYFIGLFTAIIIIPAIPVWNIENSAFQIYLLIANASLFLIVSRGYFLKRRISISKS